MSTLSVCFDILERQPDYYRGSLIVAPADIGAKLGLFLRFRMERRP